MPKKFSELIEGRLRPCILARLEDDFITKIFTNVAELLDTIDDKFVVNVAKENLYYPSAVDVIIVNLNKTGDEPEKIVAAIESVIRDIDAMYVFGHKSDVFVLTQFFKYVELNQSKAIVDFRYAIDGDFTIDDLTAFVAGKKVAFFPEEIKGVTDDKPKFPPGVYQLAETKLECDECGKNILVVIDDGSKWLICSAVYDAYKETRNDFNLPDGLEDGDMTDEKAAVIPIEIRNAVRAHAFEPLKLFLRRKFRLPAPNVAKTMSCYGSQEIGCPGYKYRLGDYYCRGFEQCGNETARRLRIIGEQIKGQKNDS